MYLCEHIARILPFQSLRRGPQKGLKIKLNQFNGKSTSDIAHETTYISKICAVNYKQLKPASRIPGKIELLSEVFKN